MRSFAEHFSFEAFCKMTDRLTKPSAPDEYQKLFIDTVVPAFSAFFYELVEAGQILPLDTLGREIRLISEWNRAIAKEEHSQYAVRDLAWTFVHYPMSMSGMRFEKEENGLQKGYDAFIKQMDEGNIPFLSHSSEDNLTGESFQVEVQNWVPMFFQYKGKFSDTSRHPATRLAPIAPIDTIEVTFESGEVLAADWFRIAEFTEQTKKSDRISINNDRGIREAVALYASLGFVSVFVGNSCPRIWQRGDTIVVGRNDDYDEEVQDGLVGHVCTDLWWVTMIDRKQLERMVGVEAVASYLAENDVDTIKVEPGTYRVSFTPKYHEFGNHFKSSSFDMTGIEPYFAMEKM